MQLRSSFSGKRAVVTGAASGIGAATAAALSARGASVVLLDIDHEKLASVAERLERAGARVETHGLDIANKDAVAAVASEILARGPVDILVNNAGVAVVAPFARTLDEDWEWLLGVNVRGPLRLTRAILPSMIARRRGHVVVVSSLAGLVGAPGMVAYSTTKFAMTGFAEALRLEVRDHGVSVSTICPGYVRTNLHHATRYDNDAFKRLLDHAPAIYGMSAEKVGAEICAAIAEKKPLVVLGPEKLAYYLKRLAPSVSFMLSRIAARRSGVMGAAPTRAR